MGDGTSRVYEESYVQDDDDDSQSGMQTYFNIFSTSSDVRENMMLNFFSGESNHYAKSLAGNGLHLHE